MRLFKNVSGKGYDEKFTFRDSIQTSKSALYRAVPTKSPLRSIEDRERNEKGNGRATEATNFCTSSLGAARKAGDSANARVGEEGRG